MKATRLTNRRIEIITGKAVRAALAVIDANAGIGKLAPRTPLGDALDEGLTRVITAALRAEAEFEAADRKRERGHRATGP